MKPSDFSKKHPYDSIFKECKHEVIARNVMKILQRTGNEFRELSWEEYKEERLKDKDFSEIEKSYFDKIVCHCSTEEAAKNFSPNWNEK